MNREYCKKICDELMKNKICDELMKWAKFENADKQTGVRNNYEKSAREIEEKLHYDYLLNGIISDEEYYYIFGRICIDALAVGGEDFFRV